MSRMNLSRHFSLPCFIKRIFPAFLLAYAMAGGMPLSLHAEYLTNTDFKEGSQMWRGDGRTVFLRPDGTEGDENDPGAVPVMKIALSKWHSRSVFQDYKTPDNPNTQNVKVQVYASIDFKRSRFADDYVSDDYVPNADFCIRLLPGELDSTSDLKPGEWVTVKGKLQSLTAANDRTICFLIPPGDGIIYLKQPSITQ